MTEQVVAEGNALIFWLQTRGVDLGLRILSALMIVVIGSLVIRLVSNALRALLRKSRLGEKSLIAKFVVSVVEKTAWAFVAVIALGKLGVDVGPLIAGLGVTGFILGFAFQESLGSLAAGLMIAVSHPFKVGDYVAVAGFEGTVTELDMMAVILASSDNRKVTIPNKQAWGAPIVNYSALPNRRIELTMNIAYGSDLTLARETAVKAIAAIAGVLESPAPMAEVKQLNDNAVTLIVRAWAKTEDYWRIYFAGNLAIKAAFDQAGIDIPSRQIDVHMHS